MARLGAQKATDIGQLPQHLSGAASKRLERDQLATSTQSRQEAFPMSIVHALRIHLLTVKVSQSADSTAPNPFFNHSLHL